MKKDGWKANSKCKSEVAVLISDETSLRKRVNTRDKEKFYNNKRINSSRRHNNLKCTCAYLQFNVKHGLIVQKSRLYFLEHLNEFHWLEDYSSTCYVWSDPYFPSQTHLSTHNSLS